MTARLVLILLLAGLGSPAVAGDVATEYGLGDVRRFDDEATAHSLCGRDGVVWADRKSGYYYPKFAPEYGTSQSGAFTCYKDAKKADYWGLGGSDESMAESAGRVFLFNPEPECDYKIDKQTGKGFCAQPGS